MLLLSVINVLSYSGLRVLGFFISLMPYPLLHAFGRKVGIVVYYLHAPFRKKTLSNLAIAYGNRLSEHERKTLAKQSFQNLTITCLEFFRLKKSRYHLSKIVTLVNPDEVESLMKKGQGIVFLTGHQANWEIPFLAITERYRGIAIGRPINNPHLYRWVLSVREMHGGKIVMPRQAIREGIKTLKGGHFIGIVGDQAFPESSYAYPLLGTRAWTTTAPALLAYRTNCPIVVAMTKRVGHKYVVTGSPPLWPDLNQPKETEIPRLMDSAMRYLENSIEEHPEQWMWQHDRWKQQGIDHVQRKYRYGFILVILPKDPTPFISLLPLFKQIYPRSFLSFFVPAGFSFPLGDYEVHYYKEEKDLLVRDFRYQLVIDLLGSTHIAHHYKKLGAFEVLNLKKMQKITREKQDLEKILTHTLVKKECLSTVTTPPAA